jgi:hypothetical protein
MRLLLVVLVREGHQGEPVLDGRPCLAAHLDLEYVGVTGKVGEAWAVNEPVLGPYFNKCSAEGCWWESEI